MILCDTGPLFALVDVSQTELHARCRATLPHISRPLITTWPCFTEAMYLAGRAGGWPMQRLLWRYCETGVLRFYTLSDTDASLVQELMEQYRDSPMDLADASLVTAAEALNLPRIFTLDSHFLGYRIKGKTAFEILP